MLTSAFTMALLSLALSSRLTSPSAPCEKLTVDVNNSAAIRPHTHNFHFFAWWFSCHYRLTRLNSSCLATFTAVSGCLYDTSEIHCPEVCYSLCTIAFTWYSLLNLHWLYLLLISLLYALPMAGFVISPQWKHLATSPLQSSVLCW